MPRHLRHALIAGTSLVLACHAAPPRRPAVLPVCVVQAPPSPELALIPRANVVAFTRPEPVTIDHNTKIRGPSEVAGQLARWLGLPASAVVTDTSADIELTNDGGTAEERYTVTTTPPRKIAIVASGRAGLFYGAQAVAQIAGARRIGSDRPPLGASDRWTIPSVRIQDEPRASFRALHLDVARHFFDRDVIERYVDMLAFYRFNVFHWHLTDDQGFRLDLKSHPELKSADGSYTAADVAAVVEAARMRGITVIPEIEMPGHTRAILATHPELSCTGVKQETPRTWGIFDDVLCAGNEGSYKLVREILTEVASLFPGPYIHVGGDEVPDARWNACPKCRAAMKKANVDAVGLEHVFMGRVFDMLADLKRRPLAWDEALPPQPVSNAPIIVAWQSTARGELAASRGFDTVFAPYQSVYLNFRQSTVNGIEPGHVSMTLPWTKVHAFEVGKGPHIVGGEGALWTEFVTTQADIDTLTIPRAGALAEALWAGPRPDHEFTTRFKAQRPMLDASNIHYFIDPPSGARERSVLIDETHVTLAQPPLYPDGVIRYTRDGSLPTADSPRYKGPLAITETLTLTTALFLANGRASPPMRAAFVKEAPRAGIPEGEPRKRGAVVSYYEGEFHTLADVTKAKPLATKLETDSITLEAAARTLGPRLKADHFALVFDGYVRIAQAGVHRFEIKGDDGLRVEVDRETVVEIDEEKGAREADGEIALAAGLHPIRVTFFQGTEGKQLDIAVLGPNGRAPLDVER